MIWGKNFVWIHIGRMGGYSVDQMFRLLQLSDVHLDPLGGDWSRWKRHQTVEQREAEARVGLQNGRARISNFRRLPTWILSFAEYKKKNEGLDFTTEDLTQGLLKAEYRELETGNLEETRKRNFHADSILEYYGVREMDYLMRTEYLPTDFIDVMSRWYSIPNETREQIHAVHENGNVYQRNLGLRFSADQIRTMYASCPVWTALEKKVYGDLLVAL